MIFEYGLQNNQPLSKYELTFTFVYYFVPNE